MSLDVLLALSVFASVMAFTPGPNNILLTASGVNFGLRRTVPHMLGVDIGFAILFVAVAAGLGALFAAAPALWLALKVAGALYLLWLAWNVARARPVEDEDEAGALGTPMTFVQALAFQWVNPKAVLAAVGGVALYVRPGHEFEDSVVVLIVFTAATVLSGVTWTVFGMGLRRLLRDPRHARLFNIAMALLLVASIVPMVT